MQTRQYYKDLNIGLTKSAQVVWSDTYSMRIKEIDDQHKGLLDFVNDLFDHATGNEREEALYFREVIGKAVQYIKDHFALEEKYMHATRFQGYASHKKIHAEFVQTVVKTVKDYEEGKRLTLEKLANFLKDWVLTHVAVEDVQYAQYFRKLATRKADGRLTISASDVE